MNLSPFFSLPMPNLPFIVWIILITWFCTPSMNAFMQDEKTIHRDTLNIKLQQELFFMVETYARLVEEARGEIPLTSLPPDTIITEERAAQNAISIGFGGENGPLMWYDWETMDPVIRTRYDSLGRVYGKKLVQIVKQYGFPSEALVGKSGSSAAFILWKYVIDLNSQEFILPYLLSKIDADTTDVLWGQEKYKKLIVRTKNLMKANHIDLVMLRKTRMQLYGTHYCRSGEDVIPFPIENRRHTDSLRAALNLTPLDSLLSFFDCPCPSVRPCPIWAELISDD